MVASLDVFHFSLTSELEAREPPEARGLQRDEVRLLVTSDDGAKISHARFTDLPDFLQTGDLLVANDSATIPAALDAWKLDATPVVLHLSNRLAGNLWAVEPRKVAMDPGEIVDLPAGGMATFISPQPNSLRLWLAHLELPVQPFEYLQEWGRPITYDYVRRQWPLALYQNVYAREPGSAEMPSAGRGFSERVLTRLSEKGIGFVTLTLHTGVSSIEGNEAPYAEYYSVPAVTADAINATRRAGGRVVAVGTTVVRALETVASEDGRVESGSGWTELMITPERGVRTLDGLITGLHEPSSTHLLMLEAIASERHLRRAYQAALDERYLWHEFGDLHLLLR